MNCKELRKYLYAFADGELDTPENLTVLEHLNMCSTCTQKVNVQQQLKASLARVMSSETAGATAPESLRASIVSMIAAEARVPEQAVYTGNVTGAGSPGMISPEHPASAHDAVLDSAPGHQLRVSARRYWIPGAIAALIALAMLSVWSRDRAESPVVNTAPIPVRYTDESPTAVLLANHVYNEHLHGCELGPSHHNSELPKDMRLAAVELSKKLDGCPILRCDNLQDMPGAQFESANVCTLVDVNGQKVAGGHIVVKLADGGRISLISVHALAELKELKKESFGGTRQYAVLHPDEQHTRGRAVTVVAFGCPKASHFICAPCDPEQAVRMAEPMRLALLENVRSPSSLRAAQSLPSMLASFPQRPLAEWQGK